MRTLVLCLLATAAVSPAQDNPLSAFNRRGYGQIKDWVLKSAEKTPEETYSFKPTDGIRSFGQLIGHISDAQYAFCSAARGETNPAPKVEQTKASKADLIAALKDAFAYCDKAYDGATDATAARLVKFFGGETPVLSVLSVNIAHTSEHYGNLVTYMRLKKIVPPSSEPGAAAATRK
jgi:uncharacterized damage-inducible protein DinB